MECVWLLGLVARNFKWSAAHASPCLSVQPTVDKNRIDSLINSKIGWWVSER